MLLDLLSYDDGGALKVVPGPKFFGRFYREIELNGKRISDHSLDLPFTIDRGGEVDFGSSFELDEGRFGRTNLILANGRIADQFAFFDGEDEIPFKRSRIIDLSAQVLDHSNFASSEG